MAVARITASSRWHRAVAKQLADLPKVARELERAAGRPGLIAELSSDEVRELAARRPRDERIQTALAQVEEAEFREQERHVRMQRLITSNHRGG